MDWTLNEASMSRQVELHLGALEIPHVDERLQNDDMQILSKLELVKRGLSEKAEGWPEFGSSSGQSRHLDGSTKHDSALRTSQVRLVRRPEGCLIDDAHLGEVWAFRSWSLVSAREMKGMLGK